MNLSSHVPTSSSIAKIPITSNSPGILTATGKLESKRRRNSKSDAVCEFSNATARCIPWRVDGKGNGETCRNRRRIKWCGSFRIWNLELSWRRSDWETCCLRNSYRETWSIQQFRNLGKCYSWNKEWPRNLHMSPARVPHMETVFSIVTKIIEWEPADPMEDLDVNAAIWGVFLNTTLQSSSSSWTRLWGEFTIRQESSLGSLWDNYSMKLEDWSVIKQKSLVWKRLISKNLRGDRQACCAAELIRPPMPKPTSSPDDPSAAWKNKIKRYSENNHFKELNRIDGMQTEFEWTIFPRFTTLDILEETQNFDGRLTVWTWALHRQDYLHVSVQREKWNTEKCVQNSFSIAKYARRFPRGRWSFSGTWIGKEMVRDLFW